MKHLTFNPIAASCVIAFLLSTSRAEPLNTMQDLGLLNGSEGRSPQAFAVSKDGTVIVGNIIISSSDVRTFRWTAATGMRDLGTLPGITNIFGFLVSQDGAVIAGNLTTSSGSQRVFRWTASQGIKVLETLGSSDHSLIGMSSDGTVLLGRNQDANGSNRGFLWTTHSGMRSIGVPERATITWVGHLTPTDISDDGRVVVGTVQYTDSEVAPCPWVDGAFRSTDGGDPVILPVAGDPCSYSAATDVTANGRHILGYARDSMGGFIAQIWRGNATPDVLGNFGYSNLSVDGIVDNGDVFIGSGLLANGQRRGFRWSSWSGITTFGTFGGNLSRAVGVSDDGNTVVGETRRAGASTDVAFRWTQFSGMIDLGNLGGISAQVGGLSGDGTVIVGSATNAATSNRQRAFCWGCEAEDVDGDGIPTDWELNGIPYVGSDGLWKRYLLDINCDGLSDASPLRKDLFVEVDAMSGLSPDPNAIQRVVAAFRDAPLTAPPLTGGVGGIKLHVLVDPGDQNIPRRPYDSIFGQSRIGKTFVWGEFQNDKHSDEHGFGTDSERASENWPQIKAVKSKVFRYCIFAESWFRTSSGLAEDIVCNDFMVTLGNFVPANGTRQDAEAATFMHELGHALGLSHGGGRGVPDPENRDVNFKPNYYSIMNHLWQLPSTWNYNAGWRLNYSSEAMPTLNENGLDEAVGLNATFNYLHVKYKVPGGFRYGSMGRVQSGDPEPGDDIDWNGDSSKRTPGLIAADINDFSAGRTGNLAADYGRGRTMLYGHDDWSNLVYAFGDSDSFLDSFRGADLDCNNDDALRRLLDSPLDYCAGDLNADSVVDDLDFQIFVHAYDILDCNTLDMPPGCPADLNFDGVVDDLDFQVFVVAYDALLCP